MNMPVTLYLLARALRWGAWIGLLGYSLHFLYYPQTHLDSFNRLLLPTELWLFGLGLAGVGLGMLELKLRGDAGLKQPVLGELVPPKADNEIRAVR